MKVEVKQLLVKQSEWQKSRKAHSWGDKIRQSEAARDSLGSFGYSAAKIGKNRWSVGEHSDDKS